MRDKKKMIIVGAVVLIIIVLVVGFLFVRKGSGENKKLSSTETIDEMGIHYGGSYDEFQPIEDKEDENATMEEETVDFDKISAEVQIIEEEFKKNAIGDVILEGEEIDFINKNSEERKEFFQESEEGELESESSSQSQGEVDEEGTTEVKNVPTSRFSGYAEHEVTCNAMSQEEAEAIAAQIGGTVLSCQNGTATIRIEENVDDLLARLEQQGSNLELYRNYSISK